MLSVGIAGFLPDSFFVSTPSGEINPSELSGSLNLTGSDVDSMTEQVGFFKKIISYLLFTWVIEGIPLFLGVIVNLLNLLSILVVIIYVYDKLRGI